MSTIVCDKPKPIPPKISSSDAEQRRDPWQNPPGRTKSQKDISGKTRQTNRPRPDLHQSHRERQAQSLIHDDFEDLFGAGDRAFGTLLDL